MPKNVIELILDRYWPSRGAYEGVRIPSKYPKFTKNRPFWAFGDRRKTRKGLGVL